MKNQSTATPIPSWIGLLAVIISIFIFFSCTNQKKVTRWNDKHPLEASTYAADHFPCRPGDTTVILSTDDTAYNNSIAELNDSLDSLNSINGDLLHQLMNADTGCRQYLSVIRVQSYKISDMKFKLDHVEPKIVEKKFYIPVIDSAKSVATRLLNEKLTAQLANREQKIIELERKYRDALATAKIRLWMLISSGLLISILMFFLFKKKTNPIAKLEKLT